MASLLTAAELADLAADFLTLLTDTADVYAEDAVSGGFTVLVRSALACELAGGGGAADPPRAEQDERRRLLFDPAYVLSDFAQLAIAGARWNVVAGSIRPERVAGGGGLAVLHGCDVARAG